MLTILNDPAGATGRTRHAWDYSHTMQQNVEQHLAAGGGCTVLLNGLLIDPATNPRMDDVPSELDELVVVQRPEGIETWILAISLVLSIAAVAMIPKPQVDAVAKDSPNNRLTQQTNVARAYQAIPDVYGYCRVWPDLLQPSTVEYIDNVKYVTEWLCVSRGRGDLTDIRYADTPIADIDGASFEVFQPATTPNTYPEQNDTTLTDVLETFETPDVNGQEIRLTPGALPVVTSRPALYEGISSTSFQLTFTDAAVFDTLKDIAGTGTALVETFGGVYPEDPEAGFPDFYRVCTVSSYSTSAGYVTFVFTSPDAIWPGVVASGLYWQVSPLTGTASTTVGPFTLAPACDGIRWNIIFLRGLKGTVGIDATYWQIDSGGAEISGTRATLHRDYTDDTYDQRYYTETIFPSAGFGTYRIEFERTNLERSDGADVAKLEEVYAVRRYATKVLPGVTVVRVTTKATNQATGFAERKFNAFWQRHVRTLSSSTISASRNFARAMAHVWALAGESMTELDTTALAAVNSSLGETSPLLRFDGTFDDVDTSLGERLQRIAYHARCAVWRDGTKWTVTRDEEKSSVEMQLDYRNLAKDGQSGITYAAHLPASNDGVEVEFVDETAQKSKAYVRLNISSGSVVSGSSLNPLRVKMPGCRTLLQATNRAHLEARRLLYQRTHVTDTALADAGSLGIGSLVRWIDPNDFAGDDGLQGGEVLEIVGTTITTSERVDWRGNVDGQILLTGIDGAYVSGPINCAPGVDDYHIVLDSMPGGAYVRNGTTRQAGSRYAFGPGLSDAELAAAGRYTVTALSPAGDRNVGVALANYDPRLYTFDGTVPGIAGGRTLTASASLIAGSASASSSSSAAGGTLTATASLVAGSASGSAGALASGRTLTATASLIAGSAIGSTDPTFSSNVLLLNGDGANDGTTFTDLSTYGHSITRSGNVVTKTDQLKYGTASLYFDGTGDWLTVGSGGTEWDFGTGDFTIELWVRPTVSGATYIYIDFRNSGATGLPVIYTQSNAFRYYASGALRLSSTSVPTNGVWTHFAVCRASGSTRLFFNGTQEGGSYVDTASYNGLTPRIGSDYLGGSTHFGYLDDIRIKAGVALYTANFTPPASAHPTA